MEEALRARLLATAALTNLVDNRVDWAVRPQGKGLPAVALHLIDDRPQMNLSGSSGWSAARVQADCWGRSFKAARDVANIICRPAGAGGLLGLREKLGGIRFRIFVIDRSSDTDTDGQGAIHRTRVDLNVLWNPS